MYYAEIKMHPFYVEFPSLSYEVRKGYEALPNLVQGSENLS